MGCAPEPHSNTGYVLTTPTIGSHYHAYHDSGLRITGPTQYILATPRLWPHLGGPLDHGQTSGLL